MSIRKLRKSYALQGAALAIAAAAFAAPAAAQTPNVTGPEVNVLNLLSPFLSLNGTTIGQTTLTANLNNSIAINQSAAASPVIAAVSISDKDIMAGPSTSLGSAAAPGQANTSTFLVLSAYGPASNLAGGSPVQTPQSTGGISPSQPIGGLGNLGAAYQAAVNPNNPGGAPVPGVVALLGNAINFTFNDLGVAKNYFANGAATNPAVTPPNYVPVPAVAPPGFTLPVANGLPNTVNSVYDLAYGVKNTGPGQDVYGDSRPVQVAPNQINGYDPTALGGLGTNPSFPSGHTTYGYTDGILIGMMVPQFYQAMLLRASEYGNSRIDLGVHYTLDIIGSRALASFELSQLLNATNPNYLVTNVLPGQTGFAQQNLNTQFTQAAPQLNAFLNTQAGSCGGSLTACAANNPYNTYSASTYANAPFVSGVTSSSTTAQINSAVYQSRLTYGLPTLSFTAAPRELTDTQGNSAAILLATLYGGTDNNSAKALANSVAGGTNGAGIYGNLATATINQIIANTETNAIAAFFGTSLSYWSRIDLYDAAGYFTNPAGITGTINLAKGDVLNLPVTVAAGAVFGGPGTVNGALSFLTGGALGAQGNGTTSFTGLSVNGTATFQAGSKVELTGVFLPGISYTLLTTTTGNKISLDPSVTVDTSTSGNLMALLTGKLSVIGDPMLAVLLQANFGPAAQTPNQLAVANALSNAANAGNFGPNGATLLANLIANNTVATAPAAFNALSGEGISGQQQTALNAGSLFVTTVLSQATYLAGGRENNIFGLKDGGYKDGPSCSLKDGYDCAIISRGRYWAAGFGEYATLDGQASTGSAGLSSHNSGFASGVDYVLTRNWIGGIAAGYSNSNYSVSDRATTGTVEGGHVAVYGVANYGDFYAASTASFAHYDNTSDRLVTALGGLEEERGRFSSDEWVSRFEAGYKFRFTDVNVTPFSGYQFAELSNGAFSEFSTGVAGLHVNAQTIDSERYFLGVQFDTKTVVVNGWVLNPYARISWEHEFNPNRNITASFLALPGASFTVFGPSAAADLARLDTGFKVDITPNVALFASFDGEFADRGNSYAGTGGIKFRW